MIMISIMEMEKQVKTLRNNSRNYLAPLFLRLRCPSCEKLYRMDTRDVKSSEPHFECLVCQSVFGFEYPTSSPLNVPTKLIRRSQARLEGKDLRPMDVKTCPKCAALNAKGSEECRQCGVIFARLNGLPLDSKMGALPSLVKAWQDLMSDYSNLTKHLHFVNRCEDLQAVPYALKKYQDLKEAQPQDQIAQEMLHRVLMRRFAVGAGLVKDHPSVQETAPLACGKSSIVFQGIERNMPFQLIDFFRRAPSFTKQPIDMGSQHGASMIQAKDRIPFQLF
jgi:ribosomal protein L40E